MYIYESETKMGSVAFYCGRNRIACASLLVCK